MAVTSDRKKKLNEPVEMAPYDPENMRISKADFIKKQEEKTKKKAYLSEKAKEYEAKKKEKKDTKK